MQRTIGVLITAAVVGLAGPAAAQAKTVKGVVVDRAAAEKSFVVATKKAELVTVNAKRVPNVGARVKLKGRNARGGEFAAKRVRNRGTARKVTARGTVTVRGPRSYLVAGRSGTIQVARRTGLARAASADAGPEVGDIVVVKLVIDGSDLGELRVKTVGHDAEFEVEGVIEAVDLEQRTLTISPDEWEYETEDEEWSYERKGFDEEEHDSDDAEHDLEDGDERDSAASEASDDADEGSETSAAMFDGSSVLVNVPEAFDLSVCQVGDEVEVEVEYDDETGYALIEIEGCDDDDQSDEDSDESDEDSDESDEE